MVLNFVLSTWMNCNYILSLSLMNSRANFLYFFFPFMQLETNNSHMKKIGPSNQRYNSPTNSPIAFPKDTRGNAEWPR